MRPAPRKLSTEDALYTASLRALMRRAHSVFEMRVYLERRAETPGAVPHVLTRLKREKMIDDARYALEFARAHAIARRQGHHRIARELRQRGVPNRHIEAAIAQVFTETDETMLIRKVIERRMRASHGPFDQKKMASLYRTLLRAGFDTEQIRRETKLTAKTLADESPETVAEEEL